MHRNSRKKVMFPRGSWLSLSNDVEVFEVSPPSYISSAKTKDKEVDLYHEIIDVDVEEDDDITLTHVIQKTSRKESDHHMDTRVEVSTFPSNVPETTSSILLSASSKGSKRPAAAGVLQINAAGGKKGKISSAYNVEEGHSKKISNLNYYPSVAMSSANGGGYQILNVPATTLFTPQEFPNDDGVNQQVKNQNCAASSKNVDEILQKYDNFKKFDIVDDFPDHFYRTKDPVGEATRPWWARKIQQEWRILEKDLPDKIFVRACESRMDLMRAVIIGAEGTPYHDGLYFFDVFLPGAYPSSPPHVNYCLGGAPEIHRNIHLGGRVCLSLLNAWYGAGNPWRTEHWIPQVSTILQVLVSIQGLIFSAKPYFFINEHERDGPHRAAIMGGGDVDCEKMCAEYNEKAFISSLLTMDTRIRRPPKHFEEFVAGHFCKYGGDILVSCKAYLDGAQVGSCLVKGGIVMQDVDEGDTSSSKRFRAVLPGYMSRLVKAFSQLGAAIDDNILPPSLNSSVRDNGNFLASFPWR